LWDGFNVWVENGAKLVPRGFEIVIYYRNGLTFKVVFMKGFTCTCITFKIIYTEQL
jgi:hypothetical protein